MSKPTTLRCAVYTRKSSEEGLDQDYNSLHAQRDACEAYVRSQVGEGWTCLPTAYDDGGISGGTMERPGLKQLLADIAARRIDVVVVYKVDRLTRSLGDFARIVEIFDKHQVSFVSVTQAFNTTSSMGRLTLNVLLSFAQFEREVTGERIRDKIAASKKKGMWMGGNLPLGYDADGRTLKINEAEAETVRHIYRRYLELRSTHLLQAELNQQGIRSKLRTTKAGGTYGGEPFSRGALFHLLSNRTYLGLITHKEEAYPGLHKAIVDQNTFDRAQTLMKSNSVKRGPESARRAASALAGLLFDQDGHPMTPTFANGRGGKRYRYYVSAPLLQGQTMDDSDAIRRVPGDQLDGLIGGIASRCLTAIPAQLARVNLLAKAAELTFAPPVETDESEWSFALERVAAVLHDGERAWWNPAGELVVSNPVRARFRGGRMHIDGANMRPVRRRDRPLIDGLRRALDLAAKGGAFNPEARAPAIGVYDRKLVELAFLAPDLQQAIMQGDQPAGLSLADLLASGVPPSWAEQRRVWGLGANR